MSWFSNIFAKRQTQPKMPEILIEPFGCSAGVPVTPFRAQTFSAVYRAIAIISQTIGFLPWSVYKDMAVQTDHPVHYLLHSRPCKEMGASSFKETMMRDVLTWGNAYAEIEFSRGMKPIALWRLCPSRISVFRDEDTGEIIYRYFGTDAGIYDLPSDRIFHLKGLGDGLVGDSIIGYAAKSIAAGIAAEDTNNSLLQNQLIPTGILKHPAKLSPEAGEHLREQFKNRYAGRENVGKPLVLEEGMEYIPISVKPEDAQFLESRRFSIEEVARWFGVPPHKLADLERATYSNIEHQSQEFVNDALMPWCKKLEEEADYKLLRWSKDNTYSKIDVRGLLRGDNKSRMEYYKGGVLSGIFSINDCRGWEDLPPVEGGDEHFVQSQMVPVSVASTPDLALQHVPDILELDKEKVDEENENVSENAS